MTNFKQTPRHVTLQHISLAKAATCPNKEVATHEGARRHKEERRSDSDDFKTDTPSGSGKDVASSPKPISPVVDEEVDVENISSDEEGEDEGREEEESGEDGEDSVSGFSSSSTAGGESKCEGSEGTKEGDGADTEVEILAVVEA